MARLVHSGHTVRELSIESPESEEESQTDTPRAIEIGRALTTAPEREEKGAEPIIVIRVTLVCRVCPVRRRDLAHEKLAIRMARMVDVARRVSRYVLLYTIGPHGP